MSDLHDLAAPYALDALDELERARFEDHMEECAACRHEVALLGEGASHLSGETAPPAGMRSRVLAQLDDTPQVASPQAPKQDDRRPVWWWIGSVAAAIAIVLSGVTAFNAFTDSTLSLSDVQAAADARTIPMEGAIGLSAEFVYSAAEGRGFFVATGIESPGTDQTYELWLIDSAGAQPAGLFRPSGGAVTLAVDADLTDVMLIGVTVEPAGGSLLPTGEILLLGRVG